MFNFRRLHITLLELLIVIMILGVVTTTIVIGIQKALMDQRFRSEVSMLVDDLRLAQDLMLILKIDVEIRFAEDPKGEGINYWMELDTILPQNIQREIIRKNGRLKTIKAISLSPSVKGEGKLDLKFLSQGAVMSKGILRLSTVRENLSEKQNGSIKALESYISLVGFPSPIFSTDSKEMAEAQFASSQNPDFEMRLTQDTVQKIPEKLKQPEEEPKKSEESKKK